MNNTLSTHFCQLSTGDDRDHFYEDPIDDGEAQTPYFPEPIYTTGDLVKHWCNEGLSLESTNDANDYLVYECQMKSLESILFADLLRKEQCYTIDQVNGIIANHANKQLVHFVLLERILYRLNELREKENAAFSFPVQRKIALVRLECLSEYVKMSMQRILLMRDFQKIHWSGKFSFFVEIVDSLSLNGNLNGLKATDFFKLVQDCIEFDEPKSLETFIATMHKNRLRDNKTPFIEELLTNYKEALEKKHEKKDKLISNKKNSHSY